MTVINSIVTPKNIIILGFIAFALSLPISHVPIQYAIVVILWGWLGEGLIYGRWMYRFHHVFIPILIYLLWNIISSVISLRPLHSLWALVDNEWPLIIMLFMFWIIKDKGLLKNILIATLIISFVACLYGIFQTITGYSYFIKIDLAPMGSLYRAIGFYKFYLSFALLAMFTFFMSLAIVSEKIHNAYKYFYVIMIVSIIAIISTFARSIWIATMIVLPIFGFLKNKKIGFIIIVTMIVFILVILGVSKEVQERAASMFALSENTVRLNLWKTSINIIKDNPIFGIGEDNFEYVLNKYLISGVYDTKAHPHNDYLNVMVNSGIPGFITFISIWIITIITGFKVWKKTKDALLKAISLGATLSLIGYMIAALFQNYYGTFINCWLWWFTAGLIFTSHALEKESSTVK